MSKNRGHRSHRSDAPAGSRHGREILYGRQPVRECLRAGRRELIRLLLRGSIEETEEIREIESLAQSTGVQVKRVDPREMERLTGSGHDQGVALETGPYVYMALDKLRDRVRDNREALVLLLDHVEDPQNVGSLLRTADAMGVTAVVIPSDRAAHVTPAAVRASAGAAEHMEVCIVTNLVQTMRVLKDDGLWFTGLEAVPEAVDITAQDLTGPVGLVVGSEGFGLKRLVAENCDFLVKLPLMGAVSSLNAGVAGAIALYEIQRQRKAAQSAEQ